MRIYRLFLHRYRVFEEPLELDFPSGLIGIYGPNGAGKSYLIESIPWTLFGRSRTSVHDVRTSGSDGDCVSEIEFEHEGHLYCVRRSVSSRGLVKAQARVDSELVSSGVKDTNRFVHSILGMDVDAFRSSVFAEQKQLSAFTDASPADRQRLVLSLLGITPLDKAREMARADLRSQLDQLKLARASLPDVQAQICEIEELTSKIADSRKRLGTAQTAVLNLDHRLESEKRELKRLEQLKETRDKIVAIGKEKRRLFDELSTQLNSHDTAMQRLEELEAEIAGIDGVDSRVAELENKVSVIKGELDLAIKQLNAKSRYDEILNSVGCRTDGDLHSRLASCRMKLEEATRELAELASDIKNLELETAVITSSRNSAADAVELLSKVGANSVCPTCGQELGEGFEDHFNQMSLNLENKESLLRSTIGRLDDFKRRYESVEHVVGSLTEERNDLERAKAKASLLDIRLDAEIDESGVCKLNDSLSLCLRELEVAKADRDRLLRLSAERDQLEKMTSRNGVVLESHKAVELELKELKAQLHELGFDPQRLDQQAVTVAHLKLEAEKSRRLLEGERMRDVELAGQLSKAEALVNQFREAQQLVEKVESRSKVLEHVVDYLNEFRRSTIASLGPRLATASASLFSELTESEYDRLEVDTSVWQLRISDHGESHDLGRFSGSERDLANLAFRIAISEQIGYSFGQQIGLLVLDEIFGPLDDQRRYLMLAALESLKARFNQVIVVTHGPEMKEQMPAAIEVVKLGKRRATARVVA